MLNKIIQFSLQNRLLVLVASVLLLIGGTYTAFHTEVDVFPDLNAPTVVVMTEANGMAAEEVEQLVTFPIETAVNGATHVRRVRSSSTTGFSVVWVEFEWDTDIYLARQIVSEKLAAAGEDLPDNVGKPTLGPQSSILGELLIVGLTSDSTSMQDLRTMADWTIRPRLLSTGGVAQVAVLGGDIKEYQILVHPDRMRHYGVTLGEVMEVSRGMNQNTNGGVIYEYGNEYIVRGVISTDDVRKLGRAVIKTTPDGAPITLEDVADVRIGSQQPKLGLASEKGKPAVLITVTKQPNTGTIELTEKLEAALADLQKNLPKDVHISTDIFRQSRFIESSISNVQDSLYEGAIFVVIVLFLFVVMLIDPDVPALKRGWAGAALGGAVFFALCAAGTFWLFGWSGSVPAEALPAAEVPALAYSDSPTAFGWPLFTKYAVLVEAAALLLLAAMVSVFMLHAHRRRGNAEQKKEKDGGCCCGCCGQK